jgi:hypothetical protein
MADKDFSERVQKLMNEYGYGSMRNQLPVQNAEWPQTSEIAPQQDEVPPGSDSTIVTNGEATPMGEPRADIAAQNGQAFDSDTMAEVGSLLITIGFLLAKDKHISDKFNTPEVLDFLGKNFKTISIDQPPVEEVPPTPAEDGSVVQPPVAPAQPPVPPGADYLEQRKMFESKFKK